MQQDSHFHFYFRRAQPDDFARELGLDDNWDEIVYVRYPAIASDEAQAREYGRERGHQHYVILPCDDAVADCRARAARYIVTHADEYGF